MTHEIAVSIFKYSWSLLLLITIMVSIVYEDWPRARAGWVTNLIVAVPYLLVFGLYYLGKFTGTFTGNETGRITGAAMLFTGMAIYISSHFSLRRNWSILASVKKRHSLVKNGLYRYIRHPMYASMFLIVPGSGLLISNYLIIMVTPLIAFIYYLRAMKEETFLAENLPDYASYLKETRMFIPKIW